METNIVIDNNTLLVTNIKWHIVGKSKKTLPEMATLNIPAQIVALEEKNKKQFVDAIETFVYNCLTKQYDTEVAFCQIWLPLNTAN